MAGNYGKFIDRFPVICPAGLAVGDPNQTVATTLKEYPLVDEIDAIKHDAHIWKEDTFVVPRALPPIQNPAFKKSEAGLLLSPPVQTRYQTLIADLKSTPYQSYWNAEVGKVRDPTPGLPAGMIPHQTTFGTPSIKETPLGELVNPPKGPYEVLRESQVGHDMYKKTHDDYNPGERIDRGYNKPPFKPDKCFGKKTRYDARGIWVRCATDWYNKEPLSFVNKLEADYRQRSRPQVGKSLAPNDNASRVPKNFAYGVAIERDFFEVEDLVKDPGITPSVFKKNFLKWVSALNRFRMFVKKKVMVYGFDLKVFRKKALNLDKDKTGILPTSIFYNLCACNHLTFPKRELEALMEHLGITENKQIHYDKFIDMIDYQKDPFKIGKIDDLPKESQYYVTTYQAASCDHLFIDNSKLPPAGIPSVRYDITSPLVPEGGCRAHLENLGNETSAKAVLNPSIYNNYGLTYRDFFLPRPKDTIRNLFEKIGYKLKDDDFEKLWKAGVEHDGTGQVCVDTLKKLLEKCCPPEIIYTQGNDIACNENK